jgi:hypothetical protein
MRPSAATPTTEAAMDTETQRVYLADWSESGRKGLLDDFNGYEGREDFLDGYEVLLAYYSYEEYTGEAFVLLRKDGKLYEVNGSHCSCYGLEGQWEPEETTVASLTHRLDNGQLGKGYGYGDEGPNTFGDELRAALARIGAKP